MAFTCVLFISISFSTVLAQQRTINGRVVDEEGLPLPGVLISAKGESGRTASNAEGNYTISASGRDVVLVFSFLGLETKEVNVSADQNTVNVTLQQDSKNLEEVVVVGYGTVKRSDLTGSVSTLKGSELNRTPAASVDQLLQGKIPGVQVTTSGGQPGSGATIRIRGASSLNGSKDPLVVVDGYPWGDAGNLKQINPEDIESIEVLKDASSAAIYGSRGANGVIMITTKKGRAGESRITFSSLNTLSLRAVEPDIWRDPVQQATFDNEAAITGNVNPVDIPWIGVTRFFDDGGTTRGVYYPSIAELRGLDPNKPKWATNTDWIDLIYRNPLAQNYTLSADGGSEKTKYAISGNYYKEEGMVIKNNYDKYTGRLNLDQTLSKIVNVGTNVNLAYTNNTGQGLGVGRSPIWPVYTEDGAYFRTSARDFGNPIALSEQLYNKSKTFDALGAIYANVKITPSLQFRSTLNVKYGNSIADLYDPINSSQRAVDNKGSFGQIANGNYNDLLNENYLTFNKNFTEKHNINAIAGFSYQKAENRFSTLTGQGFVTDVLKNENLATAATFLPDNSLSRFSLASWYGRANYSFLNRYLVTFTARADGSTKFAANNKWAYFPSGALAWKANEEAFIKSLNVFSELKFRVSYGLTGNQGISPYQSLASYGTYKYWTGSAFQTGFGPGLSSANDEQGRTIVRGLGNDDLKWETTKSLDFGVDVGILNQRLTLTLDFYNKNTSDLLREQIIAPSAGYDRVLINDGEINNKGIELGLNAEVISRNDFTWSVGGNITRNRNKVVSMGEDTQINVGTLYESVRQQVTTFTVGKPMFSYYGFLTDGIIQTLQEGIDAGLTGVDAQPGEIKYVDFNKDGVVNQDDRTIIGDPNPDFFYSFNTSVRYKQFDLSAQLYGVSGNDIWDFQKMTPSRWTQRWTPDNNESDYPRANSARGWRASDFYITDGSFLRIQNVTIGYNVKPGLIKGIKSLRVYFSGNNLYTFTKFNPGFDPELGENGINTGAYPRPRALSLGLNVGF
jgi:TonB-linked SusC/RagA family outer membrane protein